MMALPVVQQAPLPIDELQPVLESAGLMLVQTAPDRHAETQAKWLPNRAPHAHRASVRRRLRWTMHRWCRLRHSVHPRSERAPSHIDP